MWGATINCKVNNSQSLWTHTEPVGPHRAQEEGVNGRGLDKPLINQLACMPTHLGRVTYSLRVSDLWFASQLVSPIGSRWLYWNVLTSNCERPESQWEATHLLLGQKELWSG